MGEESNFQKAMAELNKELEKGTGRKDFAQAIVDGLSERMEKDEVLQEKIAEGKKSLKGCQDYLIKQARKQAVGECAAVRDDTLYDWAEAYYKDENIKDSPKKEPSKPVKKESQKPVVKRMEKKPEIKKPEPKKPKDEPDGQLSLFDMISAGA
jgi:hypothetical protein